MKVTNPAKNPLGARDHKITRHTVRPFYTRFAREDGRSIDLRHSPQEALELASTLIGHQRVDLLIARLGSAEKAGEFLGLLKTLVKEG